MASDHLRMVAASPGTSVTTPGTPSTPGTPGGPAEANGGGTGGAAAAASVNQSIAGLPEDPKTREQILRERYLKGLKKRKCVVCGNTARARCPFRACKTCCSRARNACTVHVLKGDRRATETPPPPPPIVHQSQQQQQQHVMAAASVHTEQQQPWLPYSMQASMNSGYLRPGYSVPSPYNIPTPVRMGGVDAMATLDASAANQYMPPGVRAWSNSAVMDQQELQRMKSLRIAAQKEAMMTNIWRLQKLKEHAAGELSAEDEAFDRYMLNSSLLEEVFALNAEGLQGMDAEGKEVVNDGEERSDVVDAQNGDRNLLMDAIRTQLAAHPKRKEASRQKLKQLMDRAFQKLKNADGEPESLAEDADTLQPGFSATVIGEKRWEPKRFKARTEEGKQAVKTIEAFEGLMERLNQIKSSEGVQACMDQYKLTLGGNLSYLIPNLYPRDDWDGCTSSGGGKSFDGSLISSRATLLNYLSGAYLEANPAGQVVVNNRNKTLCTSGPRHSHKVKERPWETGVEKLERQHWHRKYLRGMGWWKVYAHDDTIHSMCFERANANTTILEL